MRYSQAIQFFYSYGRRKHAVVEFRFDKVSYFQCFLLRFEPIQSWHTGDKFLFDYRGSVLPDAVAPASRLVKCFHLKTGMAPAA